MPLNNDRKFFVTASACHQVMAGFETELAGRNAVKPEFEGDDLLLESMVNSGVKKLVSEYKDLGIKVSGAQIADMWKYIQSQKKPFTDGMQTTALQVAMAEFIDLRDESYKSLDMERGNVQEGEAVLALAEETGVDFTHTSHEQIFLTDGDLGVTADGVEYGDNFGIRSCAEVKCPLDKTHMKYLALIGNQADLLKVMPNYYWQAQCGLAVTGADTYHWASYHNGFKEGYNLVYVPIKPNLEHINMLRTRAARVMEQVPLIIKDIKTRFK